MMARLPGVALIVRLARDSWNWLCDRLEDAQTCGVCGFVGLLYGDSGICHACYDRGRHAPEG